MYPTDAVTAPRIQSVDAMRAALRTLAAEGLPHTLEAGEAGTAIGRWLARHGVDLGDSGCWTMLCLAGPESDESARVTATRWVLDLHACVPRGRTGPISELQDGLHLIARHFHPCPGLEAYLVGRATGLAEQEMRPIVPEAARLKRSLSRVRPISVDGTGTFRLQFGVTLAAAEVFGALRDDGLALHRFGSRLGDCIPYLAALREHRDTVAAGVADGLRQLGERSSFVGIEPEEYVGHFRCILTDGMWVDAILDMVCDGAPGSRSRLADGQLCKWLNVLARLRGWTPSRMNRLFEQAALLQDHPEEFLCVTTAAAEGICRRDHSEGAWAALALLRETRARSPASNGQGDIDLRCRRWVAAHPRGRDILWFDEQTHRLLSRDESTIAGDETLHVRMVDRLAPDRALTRGALLYLMTIHDQWHFVRITPLIEALLRHRDERRFLWKLASSSNGLLVGRAGMFIMGIIGGQIVPGEARCSAA